MALPIQFDLFFENDDIAILKAEIASLEKSQENVRKGLFARHKKLESAFNELLNMHLQLQEEIAKLREIMIK